MGSLSVVISAFNEEAKIRECLESVSFADEIIFVDNESTDKTVEIAKKYTSKIFSCPNNPMLNVNKNFGFSKATLEWILCLDADERVTPEFRDEIKKVIYEPGEDSSTRRVRRGFAQNDNDVVNGYWIPRKNIIFGKWLEHTGWYPDHQLRLFRRKKGKFPERHVHEMIAVDGKTDYLKEHIVHYNYESIDQFLHKLFYIYAPNEAKELLRKGYTFNWLDALRFPLGEFVRRFFAQAGYKDGFHGLMLSLLMAFYHLIVFAYVWEKKKYYDPEHLDILTDMEREARKGYKDLLYWVKSEQLKTAKNPFYATLLRIRRRLIWV